MCDINGPSIVGKFNIEDIIKLRKTNVTPIAEECEKLDLQIPRKFFLQGSASHRLKSRSDSDLYQLSNDCRNLLRNTDFDVSSFPSDSDITVIRVLKRSRVRGTPSRVVDGILGDGSHLPESPSMVNLATLVQGIPISCREERLIPLSSWDSPINRTASDTTVQSAMRVAAYSWIDGGFSQPQQASSSNFVSDRFFPRNIVAGLSELTIVNNIKSLSYCDKRREIRPSVIIDADLNEGMIKIGGNKFVKEEMTIPSDLDDKIEFIRDKSSTNNSRSEKLLARFFARIQKTLCRAARCFCFPSVRRDKDKLDSNDQDL